MYWFSIWILVTFKDVIFTIHTYWIHLMTSLLLCMMLFVAFGLIFWHLCEYFNFVSCSTFSIIYCILCCFRFLVFRFFPFFKLFLCLSTHVLTFHQFSFFFSFFCTYIITFFEPSLQRPAYCSSPLMLPSYLLA